MAEEKNVASANEPGQMDCLELVKKLADSYRCLVRRRELLRQQYEESKSWFYTKDEMVLCNRLCRVTSAKKKQEIEAAVKKQFAMQACMGREAQA